MKNKFWFGDEVKYAIKDKDEDGEYVMKGVSNIGLSSTLNGKTLYDLDCSLSAFEDELVEVEGNAWHEGFLKDNGFRRKYSTDKSSFWMQKNIKNTLIKNLHISVEDKKISVWCEDIYSSQICLLYECAFTEENLQKVENNF